MSQIYCEISKTPREKIIMIWETEIANGVILSELDRSLMSNRVSKIIKDVKISGNMHRNNEQTFYTCKIC